MVEDYIQKNTLMYTLIRIENNYPFLFFHLKAREKEAQRHLVHYTLGSPLFPQQGEIIIFLFKINYYYQKVGLLTILLLLVIIFIHNLNRVNKSKTSTLSRRYSYLFINNHVYYYIFLYAIKNIFLHYYKSTEKLMVTLLSFICYSPIVRSYTFFVIMHFFQFRFKLL